METTGMQRLDSFRQVTTMHGSIRRRRIKITTPTIDTYSKQIQQCQRQYTKLHLDDPPYSVQSSPVPKLGPRHQTFHILSRSRFQTEADVSASSPRLLTCDVIRNDRYDASLNMNPLTLISSLQIRGFGEPKLLNVAFTPRSSETRPSRARTKSLPRDPYLHEKLKGQARLDYEMANIRADAFCAQQRGMFRTASAGFRDRDDIFVEEEMRAQMHRPGQNVSSGSSSGDTGQHHHVDRQELFGRIQTWMDGVRSALGLDV
ncbi:uncharacterized protein LOC121382667 [Gigantopelta aegis]|uniref:uncharacterized protein LOC121382667 n=1 Tax=Gigantopelta aegis TaxID=1735272 RepID=UPI001B88D21A|nr:uncharacterized protein LOC121382667 [Gigantopelta aegis]